MQRRGFLKGLAGILAAGAAPAIIHDAMKIVVPKREIILPAFYSYDYVSEPGFARAADISKLLTEKIRDMAYQLYKESGFVAAAESIDRLVIQDPTMVRYLRRA